MWRFKQISDVVARRTTTPSGALESLELYTTTNALSIENETNSLGGITLLNTPTVSVVTGDSAVGDYYVRLVGGGGGNEAMQWSWNGLTVGNDYTFSYWARKVGTSTPYGNNWTNVIDVDGITPKDPASSTANITSTSWTKYSYDLKVEREGGISKIYTAGDGTGEVHVTGFSVKLLTDNSFQGLKRSFPTAYGAGSETYGGRGGAAPVLVKVNTLNPDTALAYDGVSNTWSGGFKDACNNSTIGDNGRIIIFTVSGNIDLGDTNFDITTPYVTILGQSAPLGGITIHSGGLRVVNTHQVIIRYLRCRNGLTTQAEWDAGGNNSAAKACGLSAVGFGHDLIFDHVSASWGGDKAILLGGNTASANQKRQTVQRCIASDSHTYFQMSNQRPDILVTAPNSINLVNYRDNISVYLTLFARGTNRTPNMGGTDGYIDVINNIVQSNGTKLGVLQMIANAKVNWNRNYYSYLGGGPSTSNSNEFQMNYVAYDHNDYYEDLQLHTRGNYYKNNTEVVLDGTENVDKNDNMEIWSYEYGALSVPNNTPMPDNMFTVDVEFDGVPNKPPLKTATQAYTSVITERNTGSCHYIKDDGTADSYVDSWDTDLFTNYEAETMQTHGIVADWILPTIPSNTRPGGYSTLNDGIEDSWRAANMSGQAYNDFAPSGYMWIEEFHNQVDSYVYVAPTSPFPLANIVAEYKFEDNVLDTVGTHDGTTPNGLDYVTALQGRAGNFNGSTHYVSVPDSDDFSLTDGANDIAYSFSWLMTFDSTTSKGIISKMNTSTEKEYYLFYAGDTGWRFRTYTDVSANYTSWDTPWIPTVAQEYHITMTTDGTTKKIFVDGVALAGSTVTAGTYTGMNNQAVTVQLGALYSDVANYEHNGYVDNVRFWNVELTEAQVLELATQELAGTDINP